MFLIPADHYGRHGSASRQVIGVTATSSPPRSTILLREHAFRRVPPIGTVRSVRRILRVVSAGWGALVEVDPITPIVLAYWTRLLRLDSNDGRDPVDTSIKGRDIGDSGSLGGGDEVRLGVVDAVGLIDL
jgi:hypothetical protein